jgi:glutamate-1-semialdehyde aminotransferase
MNGLHFTPGHGFISAAHTVEDITQLIEIYQNAMGELRVQGVW